MIRGVRARLTATIVALVVLTAAVLGIGSYLFVGARLHGQALDDARDQARFDLAVLAPPRLGTSPTESDAKKLAEAFKSRNLESIIEIGPGGPIYSSSPLAVDPPNVPADVRGLVDRGEIASAWMSVLGQPSLVVGGRS